MRMYVWTAQQPYRDGDFEGAFSPSGRLPTHCSFLATI